ncbi:MAG: MBL fold metallo-hydrolase, partial [Hyphomicrobiales bacterium]
MSKFTRRSVVLGAGATSAAFGLSGPLEIMPSAFAQAAANPMNPKGLQFFKHKVGGIEVTTVYEGDQVVPIEPSFIANASVEDMKGALKAAGLPDEARPNSYTVTFVTVGGRTMMFDSGYGTRGNPGVLDTAGRLAENAKAAGIDLGKLSAVVVTHFHPDHIFGLFGKDNAQVYENIEIVVPEAEYKFWAD